MQDWNCAGQMPEGKPEPGKKPICAKSNSSNPNNAGGGPPCKASPPQTGLFGFLSQGPSPSGSVRLVGLFPNTHTG
jgi:hypothetical protein